MRSLIEALICTSFKFRPVPSPSHYYQSEAYILTILFSFFSGSSGISGRATMDENTLNTAANGIQSVEKETSLMSLSLDVLIHIMSFLQPCDIISASRVPT